MWPHGGSGRFGTIGHDRARRPLAVRRDMLDPDNFTNFNNTWDLYNSTAYSDPSVLLSFADKIASDLNIYYTPIIVILGVIGNLLSIFVFYSSKLRLQSTSQYLSALAISDTVFLMQLLPPWLNAVDLNGLFRRDGFCQGLVYISYVSCCLSSWLVVAFTVERFVAVLYPLRRNVVCTVTRARIIICTLTLLSLLLNIPVLRFAIPSGNDCNIDFAYMDHAARFNMIDTVISFTFPLAMITILNTWIMLGVYNLERTRQNLLKALRPTTRPRLPHLALPPRSQQRVTRMLLVVSTVFVFLNMPAYSMRMIAYAYDINEDEHRGRWAALQQIALMFFNTNFGINFILYCMSGQNFRRALLNTLPWMRIRAHRAVAVKRSTDFQQMPASSFSTSFVSEVGTNTTANAGSTPNPRRRCRDFIAHWSFDNSRQRKAQFEEYDQHEMVVFHQN